MTANPSSQRRVPDVSFVMPCFNEQDIVEYTIRRLTSAFARAGYRLELVAVDNGSWDQTGATLARLAVSDPAVIHHRVEVNEGYGHGVLSGLPFCSAEWVGIIPADGQVDAEDVVRLYEAAAATGGRAVAKVRRRFRMDGILRKVISTIYNLFVRMLWPRLRSIDVNGSPKILPRSALMAMRLESKDWLLDPEIMIKAHLMGLQVLEFNVFARMRSRGLSHVRPATCWTFLRGLMALRCSGTMSRWQRMAFHEAKLPS